MREGHGKVVLKGGTLERVVKFRYFGVAIGATTPRHWGEALSMKSIDFEDFKGGS